MYWNKDRKEIQRILGTFLFYSWAVDLTMGIALSMLTSEQAKATENTQRAVTKLLNYCATHPDAAIKYCALDMILKILTIFTHFEQFFKCSLRANNYCTLS